MLSSPQDTMTAWQAEQLDALQMVRSYLAGIGSDGREQLQALVTDYLSFRRDLDAFLSNAHLHSQWSILKDRERTFKWPDQAVLFDDLEKLFITSGYRSPLMYCHTSPGLLRVKRSAGLMTGKE